MTGAGCARQFDLEVPKIDIQKLKIFMLCYPDTADTVSSHGKHFLVPELSCFLLNGGAVEVLVSLSSDLDLA